MQEVWKEVVGFPSYLVSNLGRVKRLKMIISSANNRKGFVVYSERMMKGNFNTDHGWNVSITSPEGKTYRTTIARLMLTAFDRLPLENEVVRHLDDNKHNQNLINLSWGTQKQNVHDALRNGIFPRGERDVKSKLTNKDVLAIRKEYVFGSSTFGIYALAKEV